MAKKSKKEFVLNKYYPYIVFAVALACVGMMFLPGVEIMLGDKSVASPMGWQVAFGYTVEAAAGSSLKGEVMSFSFMALLAIILPVAGGVVPLLLKGKLGALVSVGCFAVGAVFAFMMVVFVMQTTALELFLLLGKLNLGIGSILLGAFSIVGAGLGAVKILVK